MPRKRKTSKDAPEASQSSQGLPPQQAAQGRGQQVGCGQQTSQQPVESQPSPVQRVSPTGPIIRVQGRGQQASQQPVEAQPSHSPTVEAQPSPVQRVSATGPIIRGQGRGQQGSQQPVDAQPSHSPTGQQSIIAHGRGQNVPLQVSPRGLQAAAPPGRGQQVQQAPSQVVGAFPGGAGGQSQPRGGGPSLATTPRQPYVAASPISVPDLPEASSAVSAVSGTPQRPMDPIHSRPVQPRVPGTSRGKSPVDVTEQLQQMAIGGPTLPRDQVLGPSTSEVPVPSSSKNIKFPRRPGFGQVGIKCIVKANHFVAELPKKDLHHYDVSITPQVPSRRVNRDVMDQLVKIYQDSALGRRLPAYDGRKSLYTAGALPFKSKDFTIKLVDEDDGTGAPRRERQFKVAIKFAAKADLHHLGEFLTGRQAEAPQEALQVLDIVLRELPTRRFSPVGRSFYSPDLGRRQSLGEGLECWRGFYQSIRPTQMGLSLNIDMSSTAFIEPLPVIEFVAKLLGKDVSRQLADTDRIKIKKALRGVQIEVTHRGNQRRKYKILGLTSQPTQELTFPVDDEGTTRSVVEYFQEKYNYTIRNRALPCLQVGNQQRPNYLPMEVCKVVEGQRYSKRLNKEQINALLKATCQRPMERERDIVQTVYHNAYAQDRYAKEFGIKISDRLAVVEGRILPAPQLKYHDTGRQKSCQPEVGKWDMRDKRMVNGGVVNFWACITFSVPENAAYNFCKELANMCKVSGMTFHPDPAIAIQSARPHQVEHALRRVFREFQKSHPNKELGLLLAILPDNNGSLYGDLKRICETDLGLISQCVLTKQVFNANVQVLANLALKINAKVGGRNTVLVDALSQKIPLVTDKPTIIFGADVTHPHPGEDSSPSIAAVVASQDWPEVTKYAGLVCAQEHRKEIIQDLFKEGPPTGGMIRELLVSFNQNTKQKPHRIIFYRDGVSEGQFHQVLLYELDAIRKACASLQEGYQPPITFVVVQKRHHTRLFPNNHRDRNSMDRSGNILPGTVVDSTICHPTEFDFYLNSHAGIQGTSRPAHYHVLWDDNNFTADGLQQLTNNLCYTYARCTRSVSIVPPAYYAHLAAFRARFYMEPESDSGSVTSAPGRAGSAGSIATRAGSTSVRPLPPIKENVKRVMFYC